VLISSAAFAAEGKELLGDKSDGSRSSFAHVIPLLDEEGRQIRPGDDPAMPFSIKRTCGDCHSYDVIERGWHFNAAEPNVPAGRPGQPWIYVDAQTGTQIPLTYRNWPGTYRPGQVGLTYRQFVKLFGRQMPGGGPGELESDDPDEMMREMVSGMLEVNCMACHNASRRQDQAEYALQIGRENFRWAATAACGVASVSGSAKDMPDTWDYLMPMVSDVPELRPPAVVYRADAFDGKGHVFFDLVTRIPTERCYFCHSNADVGGPTDEKWMADEDVHLAAGMKCVDCHRNGMGHDILRGNEDEAKDSSNPLAGSLSCRACHLGDDSSHKGAVGRMGAPVPEHKGIPPEHFDKLACTACHAGPPPDGQTHLTKTARAHGLGTHNVNKADEALPHILTPMFVRQWWNGKLGFGKMIWPAFWGILQEDQVKPINLQVVKRVVGRVTEGLELPKSGDWPALTDELVIAGLKALASQEPPEGQVVYVCAGKVWSLNKGGELAGSEHPAAQPYVWPCAHDVRPAVQALGAKSCRDCHSTDSAFNFGKVVIDSPLVSQRGRTETMIQFQGLDDAYVKTFGFTFVFRPWLKAVALAVSGLLVAVLLLFALKALDKVLKFLSGESSRD